MPMTKTRLEQIENLQRKAIAGAMRLKKIPGEELLGFCRRRNKEATKHLKEMGSWATFTAHKAKAWVAHCLRNHTANLWTGHLAKVRNSEWRKKQRRRTGTGTRTETRAYRGHVAARLEDCEEVLKAWVKTEAAKK